MTRKYRVEHRRDGGWQVIETIDGVDGEWFGFETEPEARRCFQDLDIVERRRVDNIAARAAARRMA